MDQFLDVLFKALIVAGVFGSFTLSSFFFWSAVFIPIVKLRQHNQEKEKLAHEAQKIEIEKAQSIILIDDKKKEYDQYVLLIDEKKREYNKWKLKTGDISIKFEKWLEIENGKVPKTKGKK